MVAAIDEKDLLHTLKVVSTRSIEGKNLLRQQSGAHGVVRRLISLEMFAVVPVHGFSNSITNATAYRRGKPNRNDLEHKIAVCKLRSYYL